MEPERDAVPSGAVPSGAAPGGVDQAGAALRWVRRHRPLVDAAVIALICVVAAAFGLSVMWSSLSLVPESVSPWWGVVLAIPSIIAVAAKRRFPRSALAVTGVGFVVSVFTVGGLGTLIALLDVLWAVTAAASPRARRYILIASAIGTAAMSIIAFALSDDLRVAVLVGVQVGALLGTGYWWATAVAQANELAELHRRRAQDVVRAAETDRAAALQRERDAMARELHDLVAGHIAAVTIRAEAALSTARDPVADGAALRAVRDSSFDAHETLRSMIGVLRAGGGELIVPPGLDRVPGYVDDARRAGLDVTFEGDPGAAVPAAVEQAAARIVQESLANCVRHAAGGRVTVSIAAEPAALAVRVDSRDGRPMEHPTLAGTGSGLAMLTERVRALGGTLHAGPVGDGWSVRAVLPIVQGRA